MADWSAFPIVQPSISASPWDAFPIVEQPADTGQGYASSLLNSAGRGFARVAADIPGGLGYLTGSESLINMGDDMEGGINEFFPVNPIYQDDFAMKAAGAVGQAGSMIATGGIGGVVGKGFGAVRLGAQVGALGSGFFAGARGGGQDAEYYGMDGAAAYSRILAGGAIEVATEKYLFGLGAETRAMRRMLGETVEGGAGRFTKDVFTEGAEEFVAEVGNNAANELLAPAGTETPGLFHGGLEAFGLGMVGGATFGGFNALTGRGQAEAPYTVESGSLPLPAMPQAEASPPGQPVHTKIAGQPFYFDGVQWNKFTDPATVSASPEMESPFIPLNPANPIEGTLIVELERRRKTAMRQGEAPKPRPENGFPARGTPENKAVWDWVDSEQAAGREVPGMTEYMQEQYSENFSSANAIAAETKILNAYLARSEQQAKASPANETPVATSVGGSESETAEDVQPAVDRHRELLEQAAATLRGEGPKLPGAVQKVFGGQGSATKARASETLPDPTGTDIISALQGETMRLGQVSEAGEWDWYRELEKAAASSKLKKQEVAARVRRGELEDPAALLEWVNQNVVDRQNGAKIDEAAALLSQMDGYQSFNVDANSIGPAIMEAIGQRQKARDQGGLDEYMADREAEHLETERQQTREFLAHAFASNAPAVSGSRLSQQVNEGSKVRVNGAEFIVAEVNESEGTLDLQDESGRYGYQKILADDTLPVESVDGIPTTEAQEWEDVPEENMPFSLADTTEQARVTQPAQSLAQSAVAKQNMPTSPAQSIATVEAALRQALGHRQLDTARVEVISDPYARDPRTGRPWKARFQNGKVTLNAAFLSSSEDAVWNLEHELAHEVYRSSDTALTAAWKTLEKALASNPQVAARVEALGYLERAQQEESLVRLAQELDGAKGTLKSAWVNFKEAVWNLLSGRWGALKAGLANRAAIFAASRIMNAARAGVAQKRRTANGEAAFSFNLQPGDIVSVPTGRGRTVAEIYSVDQIFGGLWIVFKEGFARKFGYFAELPQPVDSTTLERYHQGDGNAGPIHREREALESLRASDPAPTGQGNVSSQKAVPRDYLAQPKSAAEGGVTYSIKRRPGVKPARVKVGDELADLGIVTAKTARGRGFWFDFASGIGAFFDSETRLLRATSVTASDTHSTDARYSYADNATPGFGIPSLDRVSMRMSDVSEAKRESVRVDRHLSGASLLRANLTPQQPGQNAALEAIRGALQSAQADIQRLGARVEEIDSAEAARRGFPANFTIGVTPDGSRLTVVADKLTGKSLPADVAAAVVREETIHLAWLAAMRAEHERSGWWMPFDEWMETELSGWMNELASSPTGSQVLTDAANIYDQPDVPYQTAAEALEAFEGRESLLVPELARQIIQLRESGQTTESVIARAMSKIREWFSAALQRLRAVADDVGQVSPTLDAAIKETERILAGASAVPPSDSSGLPPLAANLDPMRLTSMRMSEASDSLRERLNEHKATRDDRTVDGEPIERAGYLVRRDADMEAAADNWLDAFAEGQARTGRSMEETRSALNDALDTADVDVAAVILTRLIDGRGREFGLDPAQVQALGQKNASRAGFALREWKKTLDPLDRLVDQATATTGTEMGRQFRGEVPTGTPPADVPTVMNQQLQDEMKAEASKAALDAIESLRSANSDLRRSLREARERAEEERARADQEREVGIAIGREEGLEQGRAEQPPPPPRELDVFENWLMGERIDGLPSLEQVARRFLDPQRWDGERFRAALGQLFPALDQNILDDAVDCITVQMENRLAAARRRAISAFIDRLAERNDRLQNDQRFITFFGHLQRAADFGILDSQVFADSFAAAWGLNGLTPAAVLQLRQMYQQITAVNANGQPVYFGMERETMERRFIEAVNRVAPGQAWLNFIFNNYQARVLSSASSMLNQFSAVFRILAPVDAIARSYRMGQITDPAVVLSEYWAGISSLGRNLPLMMTAIRGESLGHLPSALARGHVPTEQQTQHLQPGEAIRVGRTRLGPRASWLARMTELWTWRAIRAAEGLTGIADAEAHFRETLTNHYRDQGMTPAAARQQALQDIHASPALLTAARQQAQAEQQSGAIGTGQAVIERRVQEIIQREIDTRLSVAATDRTEQLTGYAQFKTMPVGPVGFAVARFMAGVASPAGSASRYARFWFLFGRFLGHSVDVSLGYTPGAHLLTKRIFNTQNARRQNLINEVFGSEAAYNRMVDSRAVTGASFMVITGGLMGLAALMAGDDDEPWFAVTGSGGLGDQARKDALQATGKWGEMQVRIGGRPILGYSQIPELAPLLGILGNISDHMRFGDFLNQRMAREGEQPGKYPADVTTLGLGFAADWALSPIKRSTYRAWFDTIDGLLGIQSAGGADYAGRQIAGLATRPIDGMLRVPVVVDVDKAMRFAEGSLKPDGVIENVLRRVPFVHVGQEVFNAYGERSPAWDIFTMFPTSPEFSDQATRAARLNVETGTRRGAPQDISLRYSDGTVRELKPNELTAYQELSGQIYTESLLRNEVDIRRAYLQGGQGAAAKIVENISAKANKEARRSIFGN